MELHALMDALRNGGRASAGTNTTLTDSKKMWTVDQYAGVQIKILVLAIEYNTTVVSNTTDTLTFGALPGGVLVPVGATYFFPFAINGSSIITAVSALLDGVHFNPVEGTAGTVYPIGTPEYPVNNLADALTMMAERKTRKLYLNGARTLGGLATANNATVMTDTGNEFTPNTLVGLTIKNTTDGSSGVITANTLHTITVAALVGGGANTWVIGDAYLVVDTVTLDSPYVLTVDRAIDLEIIGNPLYDIDIVDSGLGLTYNFNSDVTCRDFSADSGDIYISGDFKALNAVSLVAATLTVFGNAILGEVIANAGTLSIYGDAEFTQDVVSNAGTIHINHNAKFVGVYANSGNLEVGGNARTDDFENEATGTVSIIGNLETSSIANAGTFYANNINAYALDNTGTGAVQTYGSMTLDILTNAATGSVTVAEEAVIKTVNNSGALNVTFDLTADGIINDGNLAVNKDLTFASMSNTGVGTVNITLNARGANLSISSSGAFAITGNLKLVSLANTGIGNVQVYGDLYVSNGVVNTGSNLTVGGKAEIYGSLINEQSIAIGGDLICQGLNNSTATGSVRVVGDAQFLDNLSNGVGSTILVIGIAAYHGIVLPATGTFTYHGVQPEQPITLACPIAETDLFLLNAAGFKYHIDHLFLKCGDPGADTVTVTLYQLINAVPTAVAVFNITTLNYTTYFSLMDMFGLPALNGDYIQVTLQSTTGGYAVTGSYGLRTE